MFSLNFIYSFVEFEDLVVLLFEFFLQILFFVYLHLFILITDHDG
jgi:hypothetical protein